MRHDRAPITLAAILEAIGPNVWAWHLFEFSGVGTAPRGIAMADFEQEVRAHGYRMTWDELRRFASEIEQVWDCLIIGLDKTDVRTHQQVVESHFTDAQVIIEGLDSTYWEVKSSDAFWVQQFANRTGVPGIPMRMSLPS
jgi:hypothetical protein